MRITGEDFKQLERNATAKLGCKCVRETIKGLNGLGSIKCKHDSWSIKEGWLTRRMYKASHVYYIDIETL